MDPAVPVRGMLRALRGLRQVPAVVHPRGPPRLRPLLRGETQEDLRQRHQEPAAQLARAPGARRGWTEGPSRALLMLLCFSALYVYIF